MKMLKEIKLYNFRLINIFIDLISQSIDTVNQMEHNY